MKSGRAAGRGAASSLVVFLLSTAAGLEGAGRWWALPTLVLMLISGVLCVALTLVWGGSIAAKNSRNR